MKERKTKITRKSQETDITAEINLDGTGKVRVDTPIGILNHMLTLMAFHGCFDLTLKVAKADTDIDIHHANEDIGIVLGKAFEKALGKKQGIKRFGSAQVPMESTVGHTVVDICGRGHFGWMQKQDVESMVSESKTEEYSLSYLEHFMESFAKALGATINIQINHPSEDLHTNLETIFKSLGLALDQATQIDPRRKGMVPSTKGIID